jgi:hypothetical protein
MPFTILDITPNTILSLYMIRYSIIVFFFLGNMALPVFTIKCPEFTVIQINQSLDANHYFSSPA